MIIEASSFSGTGPGPANDEDARGIARTPAPTVCAPRRAFSDPTLRSRKGLRLVCANGLYNPHSTLIRNGLHIRGRRTNTQFFLLGRKCPNAGDDPSQSRGDELEHPAMGGASHVGQIDDRGDGNMEESSDGTRAQQS